MFAFALLGVLLLATLTSIGVATVVIVATPVIVRMYRRIRSDYAQLASERAS